MVNLNTETAYKSSNKIKMQTLKCKKKIMDEFKCFKSDSIKMWGTNNIRARTGYTPATDKVEASYFSLLICTRD